MFFREAKPSDFKELHAIRMSVKENVLSNPSLITAEDYEYHVSVLGKGWVCEIDHIIIGFSIVNLLKNNIWALFVRPEYEGLGVGKQLHDTMLNWYFSQTKAAVWLSTQPNSRADGFYRKSGWKATGKDSHGDTIFELTYNDWNKQNKSTI
ncbi:GNAT family N-acetyltransferase [Solitalea koreensis]|uniref:Acetyltransferase (GNAT) domain-containing protein n=1 Tax=Solitalea koreensis TaxID=543615 RepID=A0A521C3L0_9SPHI|nr:GNAT family N-acetyltransferase [Solitalea koreensis]SMO53988.1 Acetyltransferase (GNAT) domain-containing protein [Solitalea koreensis]